MSAVGSSDSNNHWQCRLIQDQARTDEKAAPAQSPDGRCPACPAHQQSTNTTWQPGLIGKVGQVILATHLNYEFPPELPCCTYLPTRRHSTLRADQVGSGQAENRPRISWGSGCSLAPWGDGRTKRGCLDELAARGQSLTRPSKAVGITRHAVG